MSTPGAGPRGRAHAGGDPTAALDGALTGEAARWLAECCAAADPRAVLRAFPAVGRRLGRGPLPPGPVPAAPPGMPPGVPPGVLPAALAGAAPADVHAWTVDDAGRVRLLRAAGSAVPERALADLLERLYAHGDAAERRGVLRALDVLPIGDAGLPLLRDALRTNDVRLVAAAAAGRYAARELTDAELNQAVLKCLFVGVPLTGLAALPERAGPALARMVADFARERVAAGRAVPADAWLVLDRHPDAVEAAGLPAELTSATPERRAAATRFFDSRPRGQEEA
jgi:hypothetical protein